MRSTINNGYVQPLKLGISSRLVVAPNVDYNSIVLRNTHRAPDPKDYSVKLFAKFDTQDFDGIHLICGLEKDASFVASANCTFNIYSVSLDNNWTETLLYTASGVANGNKFTLSATNANLGNPTNLDGELTLAISAQVSRGRDVYKSKIYLNHLGVYDSIIRLRNKVRFLEIIKKDEGPV